MNIKIREMTIDDLKTLSSILTTQFDDFWNISILESELKNDNTFYFVAVLNEEIVGFIGIHIICDEANLMNIVVNKKFRNQKIGSKLLDYILGFCEIKNLSTITLEVSIKNSYAIELYKKFDFEILGKRKGYYNGTDALIMTKYFVI